MAEGFLPVSRRELKESGIGQPDFVYVCGDAYVDALIERNFRDLFERALARYDRLPVGVVGGFGCACRAELERLGAEYGLTFSRFIPSPMEGLVDYHGV